MSDLPRLKCRAHSSRTKLPCKSYAIHGGKVCRMHGGAAPRVKAAAARRVRDMLAEALDPDRLMREMAAIAYFDPRELFDDVGNLRPIKEWPSHVAAAIASMEIVKQNLTAGDGKVDTIVKPKAWPKDRALEMLAKFHGKLKEQVEHSGGITIAWKDAE